VELPELPKLKFCVFCLLSANLGRDRPRCCQRTALPRSLAGNAESSDEFTARLIVDLDLAPEIIGRTADGDHALLVQPGAHRVRCKYLVHFLVQGIDHRLGRAVVEIPPGRFPAR
jgi:hypothetical protein